MENFENDCFLCLHLSTSSIIKTSPLHSLHCLLNYLKLDKRKYHVNGELKAKLCDECAILLAKFSKLARQLEKIEMEVLSSLNLIYGKLKKGVKVELIKTEECQNSPKLENNLSFIEDLRIEAREKCLHKIISSRPRIKIHNLAMNQVTREKNKLKSHSLAQTSFPIISTHEEQPEPDIEIGNIKIERVSVDSDADYNPNDSDEVDSNYAPDEASDENLESDSSSEEESHTNKKFKVMEGNLNLSSVNSPRGKGSAEGVNKYPFILVAPSKSDLQKIDEPKYCFNRDTGRYRCCICQKQYTQRQNFGRHYKSSHLQHRYKCTLCDKQFHQAAHYYRHHEMAHLGVHFKCRQCNRCFALRHHLKRHEALKSCGKRKPVQPKKFFCHCGSGFTIESNLRYHMREVHSEVQIFTCDLCEKKFNRKGNLIKHRRHAHNLPN